MKSSHNFKGRMKLIYKSSAPQAKCFLSAALLFILFLPPSAYCASTGAKVMTGVRLGSGTWNTSATTVANLNSSDNNRGYTQSTTFDDLTVYGFDLGSIPPGSTINGIEVKVEFLNNKKMNKYFLFFTLNGSD
jgi:hypothetical protein